jgi:hypothetical protein
MPADDLVLNVRQIAGYGAVSSAPTTASLLMQLNGLGSAYASISPAALVGTALAAGGDMVVGGALSALSFSGGSAQYSNAAVGNFTAQQSCLVNFDAVWGSISGVRIATVNDLAAQYAASVQSFNGRVGNVRLWIDDIRCAGGAPIFSPRFEGSPRACTPPPDSNSSRLATTAFVTAAVGSITGDFAPIASPAFTGVPTAPTPAQGSSDGSLATTAFVMAAIAAATTGVASFNGRTGVVTLTLADIIAAAGAPIAGPLFTGVPEAPTAAVGTATTQLATTAFVMTAVGNVTSGVSSFNSRTGAVTLTSGDITGAGGALAAATVASFNGRTGTVTLLANDISGASGALLASPAFIGSPTAPTPPPGDSSTRIATTAFVATMTGFAPIASPAFTGVPTAPTAAVGTNTLQLATTAFVLAAIAASVSGVASFNSRTGAVTLLAADISAAGGALIASPAFTGTPSAPTAAPGTNTTQLATAAFVTAAIAAALNANLPNYLPLTGGTISGTVGLTIAGTGGLSVTASNGMNVTGPITGNNVTATNALSGVSAAIGGNGITCAGNAALSGGMNNIGTISQLVQSNAMCNVESTVGIACQIMSSVNVANANSLFVRNDRLDGNSIVFYFGQTNLAGRITINSSSTVQYLTTSDYRLKIVHGLANDVVGAMIDAVPIHDGEFKQIAPTGSRVRTITPAAVGQWRYPMFLAHELQETCPWAVNGEKDAVTAEGDIAPQGVDASKVVALLWAEIQNIRRRVATLEQAA